MGTEVNEVPTWHGELRVQVVDPRTETPDAPSAPGVAPAPSRRGETYVSYGIRAETTLAHFSHQKMETRKRFQDFCFLHDALTKEFPASIVPPLPDKRRIGYLIGDRFSDAFIQRRVSELQLFLERICRHPILQRATILQQFLASSEWVRIRTLTQHIDMHTHSGRPVASGDEDVSVTPTVPHGLLEQMSDTVLNAFTKVRKPDPRFRAMMAELDQNEETNGLLRRVLLRNRTHISVAAFDELYANSLGASTEDLATDYADFATALDELAVLETGMSSTLTDTAAAFRTFGELQTTFTMQCTDTVLTQLQSQLAYARAHNGPLKLRENKQLDFEGLTDYLAHEVAERDRLLTLGGPRGGTAAGSVRGTGVRGYLRSTVDRVLGVDEEQARIERLQRLEARIDELNDAVRAAHDQALALNQHVAQEHHVYTLGRRRELRDTLACYAQGNVDLYTRGIDVFDRLIASLEQQPDSSL